VSDAPGGATVPFEKVLGACTHATARRVVQYGGGGAATELLGGYFSFEEGAFQPFIKALPRLIHLKDDGRALPWLDAVRKLMLVEAAEGRPGAELMISRLADILFIQSLRGFLDGCASCKGGWLEALQDPALGRALASIHEHPEVDWTVESLAKEAGISRSAFAARFSERVGEGPLAYVTRWRMDKAGVLLGRDLPLAEVAAQVGYASTSAFSKAFRRLRGSAPGGMRKQVLRERVNLRSLPGPKDLSAAAPAIK
jgi:AraC-like DNA-binding protein